MDVYDPLNEPFVHYVDTALEKAACVSLGENYSCSKDSSYHGHIVEILDKKSS